MNMTWEIAKEPSKGSVEAIPSLIKIPTFLLIKN